MDDKKKKFVIPDAEVVDFAMEDIITESLTTFAATNADWVGDDNQEDF